MSFKCLKDLLYVSSDIRTPQAKEFLQDTKTLQLICNGITSIICPDLYDAGMNAVQALKSGVGLASHHDVLDEWESVWSGISIILNRRTPMHRDWGGAFQFYDLLISGGTHTACVLDLPDLGAELQYLPGTAVAISGKVLRHGVKGWEGGERVCAAHFMKDAVHDRLQQPRSDWPHLADYL